MVVDENKYKQNQFVTVHTGVQERGDEDITNRVFNG